MKLFLSFLVALSFSSPIHLTHGQEPDSILGPAALQKFHLEGLEGTVSAELRMPTDGDTPQWQIDSNRGFADPWDARLSALVQRPVKRNDVLLVRFRARGVGKRESGEARGKLRLEERVEPYRRSFTFSFSAGPAWKQFTVPFRNLEDLATGSTYLIFQVGFENQHLELADVEVLNYGPDQDIKQLPLNVPTYAGIEADAPWRRAAQERIEKYRKGNLIIAVVDKQGHPAQSATIDVHMVRQAYGFGSAVSASRIGNDGQDPFGNRRYRQTIEQLFNMVNFENDLKWSRWENQDRRDLFRALDWLDQRRIEVRGCCLVWAGWHYLPEHLRLSETNPLELRQRVESHIRDIMVATQGRIAEWDVINEPYANHILMDILGREAMVDWFKQVHRYDPRPVLYLNDYAGFMVGGENSPHKDAFEETVLYLKAQGAPIGGLGIQAHFGWDLTPPERLIGELDRWAALGLKIAITEFDIDISDEQLQGQYLRDFMTAVFSHPATDSIGIWGFWEKIHWQPDAALFRSDWSIKPAGQAWMDLVQNEWRTNLTTVTNAQGLIETRGFLGDYAVIVKAGDSVITSTVTLPAEGAKVILRLPN